ncbi:hypothetical protein AMJ85_11595 [candidate division BRC1 bacterium SM23_51]|nr:MAG: hypothetical protein AMJ85_11595 [candidate division BRC1 bacterium SM23_51]
MTHVRRWQHDAPKRLVAHVPFLELEIAPALDHQVRAVPAALLHILPRAALAPDDLDPLVAVLEHIQELGRRRV